MTASAPDPSFWSGKRVLITGHTGFKGSWLALWLHQMGADVHGIALPPDTTNPNLFSIIECARWMASSSFVDITHRDELQKAVDACCPEIVLHLAAQSLVRTSYESPLETIHTNVIGTANLLESLRSHDAVRAIVVVTSDKCYENRESVWSYREHDLLGGSDPYSASKAAAEIITASYRRSFFQKPGAAAIASVRAGNVFGGGDWAAGRLIPDMIRTAASGQELRLRYPHSIRPWQHVLDPLSGYIAVAERLWHEPAAHACAWNFGPPSASHCEVQELVKLFAQSWTLPFNWSVDKGEHPAEHHQLRLDSSLAEAKLGWQPRLDLTTAVAWTAAWYQTFMEDPSACLACTKQQVTSYQTLPGLYRRSV
jgi:CDP-glucose 4,6-dehydratase